MPSIPQGGLTPLSAYTLTEQNERTAPPAILADDIDPDTGDFRSITSSARIADGMVVHALRTQRGTGAAVRELGQRWREITHVDDQSPELVESLTREALQLARDAGVVRLVSAAAQVDEQDPSQVNHEIKFQDLLAPPNDDVRRLTFTE